MVSILSSLSLSLTRDPCCATQANAFSFQDDPNNDGSGSIKDFRNKMWSTAQKEDEDKWVTYAWNEGVEDSKVTESLERLLVHEDKRDMLECKSRGLDYLDRQHK